MAFKAKDQRESGSGLSRVVVFTEERAGHFNGNPVFHAVQCLDSDPIDLVERILKAQRGGSPPPYLNSSVPSTPRSQARSGYGRHPSRCVLYLDANSAFIRD